MNTNSIIHIFIGPDECRSTAIVRVDEDGSSHRLTWHLTKSPMLTPHQADAMEKSLRDKHCDRIVVRHCETPSALDAAIAERRLTNAMAYKDQADLGQWAPHRIHDQKRELPPNDISSLGGNSR